MEGCKHKRLFPFFFFFLKVSVSRRAEGGGRGDGEAGLVGGGVIPLWKMYWSSWKNRSKKKKTTSRAGRCEG